METYGFIDAVSFWGDENVLVLNGVAVAQHCECAKCHNGKFCVICIGLQIKSNCFKKVDL